MKKLILFILLIAICNGDENCHSDPYWPKIGCKAEGTFCTWCEYGNQMVE